MTPHRGYLLLALAFVMLALTDPFGPPPAAAVLYRTEQMMIPMTESNGSVARLQTLVLIPQTGARFPLAVVSHGAPRKDSDRPRMAPTDLLDVGTWLVGQGYAVAIPMRRGYGLSQGSYAEGYGPCQHPNFVRAGRTSAEDIEAVVRYMQGQSFVDASRVILVGHSAGAWGSIAAASEDPPGVVAAVVFAPGRASRSPDEVCEGDALVAAARIFGETTRIPVLFVDSANDHYFNVKLAKTIFGGFGSTTQGTAEFLAAPSCLWDGHMLIHWCPNAWHSVVAAFLQKSVGGN